MATKDRSAREAHSEVSRELGVRRRCYSRWIADGKLSEIDAQDRLERLERALDIIERSILLEEVSISTAALTDAAPKTVRVEGFKTSATLQRGKDETDEAWANRVKVVQQRASAGLSPELVT